MGSSAFGFWVDQNIQDQVCQTNEICIIFSHYDYSSLLTYTSFFN